MGYSGNDDRASSSPMGFDTMNAFNVVLWSYVFLLLTYGVIGFLKAGSKASLIICSFLAALLGVAAFSGFGEVASHGIARYLVGGLGSVFFYRAWERRQFIPDGLMTLASLSASGLLAGWDRN